MKRFIRGVCDRWELRHLRISFVLATSMLCYKIESASECCYLYAGYWQLFGRHQVGEGPKKQAWAAERWQSCLGKASSLGDPLTSNSDAIKLNKWPTKPEFKDPECRLFSAEQSTELTSKPELCKGVKSCTQIGWVARYETRDAADTSQHVDRNRHFRLRLSK